MIIFVNLCFVGCVSTHRQPVKLRIDTTPSGAAIDVRRGNAEFERVGTSPVDVTVTRVQRRQDGRAVGGTLIFVGGLAALVLGAYAISQEDQAVMTGSLVGAGVAGLGYAVLKANTPDGPPSGLSEDIAIRFSKPGFEEQTFVVDPTSPMLASTTATLAFALPPATQTSTQGFGPSVAVLPIVDDAAVVAPQLLDGLREDFVTRLSEYGFRPASPAQTDAAVAALTPPRGEPCIDEACRATLTEALGTDQTLRPSIISVGPLCVAAAAVYAQSSTTATDAATEETDCTLQALEVGFDDVAYRLRPEPPDAVRAPPLPPWAAEQLFAPLP